MGLSTPTMDHYAGHKRSMIQPLPSTSSQSAQPDSHHKALLKKIHFNMSTWNPPLRQMESHTDCHFRRKGFRTLKTKRQHEALHTSYYICQTCPGRHWATQQRATEHAVGHNIQAIHHPPRPLADRTPLLLRWADLNPSLVLRRVRISDETPTPAQVLSLCALPPPKESHPGENEVVLAELTDLEEALGDGTSPWEEGELETVLDEMLAAIEGDPPTEPAGDNRVEPPESRPMKHTTPLLSVTVDASLRARLGSIRGDLYDATQMIAGRSNT